jgi:tetratricopeptide (TPR) repeat protein
MRPHKQAAHMIASDPIKPLLYLQGGGRPHMHLHEKHYRRSIHAIESMTYNAFQSTRFRSVRWFFAAFADPLEMWGEALMAKNRSDLALAKFEEAAKYAPNWGRLHLKWGEALFYAGRKDDAQKQFALASQLDLSSDDKAELVRVSHG